MHHIYVQSFIMCVLIVIPMYVREYYLNMFKKDKEYRNLVNSHVTDVTNLKNRG